MSTGKVPATGSKTSVPGDGAAPQGKDEPIMDCDIKELY
jgi:hypothetical protein